MRAALLLVVMAGLSACGGGSGGAANGGASQTAATTTSTPGAFATVAAGTTHLMVANETVLVQAGAVISGPDGSTITVNGQSNTVNVVAGTKVTVPATATGAATNQVVARAASQVALAVSEAIAGGGRIGGGETPLDGSGSQARFGGIYQLVADKAGNLFASDRNGIRQITPYGAVTTLSSTPSAAFGGLALDAAGNFYGTGAGDDTIYRRTPDGVVKPWFTGWNGGVAPQASVQLAVDGAGNVYLSDYLGKRILKFSAAGVRSVLAGGGPGDGNDGVGAQAAFHGPSALAFDASGALLVNDSDAVRRVLPDGTVKTVAHIPKRIIPSDGSIAVDAAGNAYVAGDSDLRQVKPDGTVIVRQLMGGLPYTMTLVFGSDGRLYAGTGWAAPVQLLKIEL